MRKFKFVNKLNFRWNVVRHKEISGEVDGRILIFEDIDKHQTRIKLPIK
jgi:hypothetical protein